MDKKLDELLYDSLKPENEPDPELNRRILDRRLKRDMSKLNLKKTAAAAAIGCILIMGGVSAYAAANNTSILNLFAGESKEVKNNAQKLLDTEVKQNPESDKKQKELVHFRIREAVCDKNQVIVQVEAKAENPDKYLLITEDCVPEEHPVSDLCMDGLNGDQKIADYAKSINKECLKVSASIRSEVSLHETTDEHMEPDGTLLLTIRFDNKEKDKTLNYVCHTDAFPANGRVDDGQEDDISFTLTDKSSSEVVRYVPVSKEKISGTDFVVDEVTFEKSDLGMMCNVSYHYAGKSKNWWKNADIPDIRFFMLDSNGNIIESSQSGPGGYTTAPDKANKMTQCWHYSLSELPDTIRFLANDSPEKNPDRTVEVKLAK